ncbi:MAG: nitroreductase [Desulfobacterales bacterium]|nr:nitroreductase [Desulfobacterales bacterium]
MFFSLQVVELIKKRYSCRTYLNKPIEEDKKDILKSYLSSVKTAVFNTNLRFGLITATEEDRNALKGLGTYGFIKDPPGFIVGAAEDSKYSLEDYGYAMEKIILFSTDIGFGTCWLGGTFNKSNFAAKISKNDDEIVPAVASIGYKKEKRSTMESIIRWTAGSDNRLSWDKMFFNIDFETPMIKEDIGEYAIAIEMVRLAPSASNKQPWRIVKDKNIFHFYLQRTKGYERNQKLFKTVDLQRIDMGIAMCHFELSAKEMNLEGKWEIITPQRTNQLRDNEYLVSWIGH